jgi:hypothetical protein
VVLTAAAALSACGGQPKTGTAGQSPESPMGAVVQPPAIGTSAPATSVGAGGVSAPGLMQPQAGIAGSAANPQGGGGAPGPSGSAGMTGPMAGAAGAASPMTGAAGAAASPSDSLYDSATGVLRAPASGDGVQITTSMFDLPAGAEAFTCYHSEIPVDGEIDVRYYESVMAKGSHHFILYKNDGDTSPLGTMDQSGCLANPQGQNWVYSSAQPHIDLQIPEGVAIVLGSRQRVVFDMHYINTTQETLHAQVSLNVLFAKGTFQKAASLISYNGGIFIPANGTQTVGGDCTPGAGAKFFYMLTHTHRRGILATITRVLANGQMGEELVKSTNWEIPQEKKWLTAPYLTFQPGETFHYSCDYQNDLDQVVTAGPSAATNEMCMAITYYFPASAGGSCN